MSFWPRSEERLGVWLEVTTLVIPGENDSDEELGEIAAFLARIDGDIPWHVSQFHPDYQFDHRGPTPVETLKRARDIGRRAGLRYVYLGNVREGTDTFCPRCREPLVERTYMRLGRVNLNGGKCPTCGASIGGVWS